MRSLFTGALTDVVVEILRAACREIERDQDVARSHIFRAVKLLRGESARLAAPGDYPKSGLAPWRRRLVEAYIEEYLDGPIKLNDMAAAVDLSPSHFTRAFKRSFGETPGAYLNRRRIARSMEMMLETDEALSRIAVACGLYDQAHLSRIFRRTQGISPARWRTLSRTLASDAA